MASTARWRGPPRRTGAPSARTSSGPRMRNSSRSGAEDSTDAIARRSYPGTETRSGPVLRGGAAGEPVDAVRGRHPERGRVLVALAQRGDRRLALLDRTGRYPELREAAIAALRE